MGQAWARQLLHGSLAVSERKPERELRRLALGGQNTRAGTLARPNTMLYPCTEAWTSSLSGIFCLSLNSKRMEEIGPISRVCKHCGVSTGSGIVGLTSRKGSECTVITRKANSGCESPFQWLVSAVISPIVSRTASDFGQILLSLRLTGEGVHGAS